MRFHDSYFRLVHGKAPKGWGVWVFEVPTDQGPKTIFAPRGMVFRAAKAWVPTAHPAADVRVMP